MVKHFCDKCKKEASLTTVKISVSRSIYGESSIELCNECLKQLGIEEKEDFNGCNVKEIPFRKDIDAVYQLIQNIVSDILKQ